jgi:UDP:flavonoid glycosyltransferase YjiC (YdhE family)
MRKTRVLFIVENVTLAQVVRLRVLAGGLDPARYEVHFASASFEPLVFDETATFARHAIHSIAKQTVDDALVSGARIYEADLLERYVAEELALFERVRPDVVVGDFRWSLAVSATLAGIPCATMINAYWSPHAARERFPVPDHPIVKAVGLAIAERFFPLAMPRVFAHFAAPLNAVRKRHRLPPVGSLVDVLTWGDAVLHPDEPSLVPTRAAPPNHAYLGHVGWSPRISSTAARRALAVLEPLGRARSLVYATLGSSGSMSLVPTVVEALGGLDVDVLLATAGRFVPTALPANVHAVDFAPGDLVARRAHVVVCNGGASTGYQALEQGTPIVGIPSNLDAYLAMTAMKDAGVGELVRGGACTVSAVRAAVARVLGDERYARAAHATQARFAALDPHARFRAVIDRLAARPRKLVGAAE